MLDIFQIWKESKGIGKLSYSFRVIAYLSGLTIIFTYHYQNNLPFDFADYFTLALAFIVPHVILYKFIRSGKSTKVIINALAVDFLFVGWVIGILDVCLIPSIAFALGAFSNHVASNGFSKLHNTLLLPLGFALSSVVSDINIHFESTILINYMAAAYGIIHAVMNSYVLHVSIQRVRNQNLEIKKQRLEIQEQSEELKVLNESLLDMNANLEEKVERRTREIELKNKKLAEYSFTNAHELRGPVARILGLIQIIDFSPASEKDKIIQQLKTSASELDEATRIIGAKLEADSNKVLSEKTGSE